MPTGCFKVAGTPRRAVRCVEKHAFFRVPNIAVSNQTADGTRSVGRCTGALCR